MRISAQERRRRNRVAAQRKRDRALAEKLRTAQRCPHRLGRYECGGKLETRIVDGRTVVACLWCERRRAGICQHCSSPVYGYVGRTRYCREHRRQVSLRCEARHREIHRDELRRRDRERYWSDPEKRARDNEYKRLWRKANPDRVREQKRRYVARQTKRYIEYHRRYNAQAKRQEKKRAQAKAAYYRDHPTRPEPICRKCQQAIPWVPLPGGRAGRPPVVCNRCCSPAEMQRRIDRGRRRAERAETTKQSPAYKPIKIKRPQPHRFAETGQRLCLTPGCDIVVTHRKKKCSKCRRREAELAAAQLAKSAGRGRRVDLERRPAA